MKALNDDYTAGRWRSLAEKLNGITQRTMRALGAGAQHPARRLRLLGDDRTMPSPNSTQQIHDRLVGKIATPEQRVRQHLSNPSRISQPQEAPKGTPAPAPPNLFDRIRAKAQ